MNRLATSTGNRRLVAVTLLLTVTTACRTATAAASDPKTAKLMHDLLAGRAPDGRVPLGEEVAGTLVKMGATPASVAPALFDVATDLEGERYHGDGTSAWAAHALREMGDAALPTLIDKVASTDAGERNTALSILARMGPGAKSAVPAIARALSTPGADLSFHGSALQQIGMPDETGMRALIEALMSDQPRSRRQAAEALQSYGSACATFTPLLVPLLARAKDDHDNDVENTLEAIGPSGPQAMAALVALLGHERELVRVKATTVLWSYGSEAKVALPELERLAGSGTGFDAMFAKAAINEIRQR